ncbi:MAG TPA: ABC transporter permease [Blastocatellia bacterium]|nr:ABC transporter permease [Blastocatellia bacterium]
MDHLIQDLTFAWRTLRRRPGYVVTAVLTLAIGIGANTAIFSVVNGVILKPFPYPHPERLVVLSGTSREVPETLVSYPDYLDWRERQTVFEEIAVRMPAGFVFTGDGEPERIIGRWVSASFFQTLGVKPLIGRTFTEQDENPAAERVVVLGYGLWQRRFGGEESVVGRTLRINAESWTVIGVMRADFDFYGRINANNDFLVPLGRLTDREYMHTRNTHLASVIGRLKPNATLEQARSEMNAIAADLEARYPESNTGTGVSLKPLTEDYLGDARQVLMMISAAVLLVLLIACANVANLLLARAAGRQKEIALRLALGASRVRIVRQLLTESVLLGLIGGVIGFLLAMWSFDFLLKLSATALPRADEVKIDSRVLIFSIAASLFTGVVFGLVPAWQASKLDLQSSLKEGGRQAGAGSNERLRGAFVVSEIALSFVLLVGAGLLLKSFREMLRVDLGFEPRNVLTVRLRLPDAKYRNSSQTMNFCREMLQRVSTLPGVQHASLSTGFPFGQSNNDEYLLEGEAEPQPGNSPVAVTHWISEGYQQTLGISLLAGRSFTEEDNETAPPVAIVDEELTKRRFPDQPLQSVLGKRVRVGGTNEPWRKIVGVVRHVKHASLDEEPRPEIDRPYAQVGPKWLAELTRVMDLSLKTSGDPLAFVAAVKREVQSIDAEQPLANVQAYEARMSAETAPRRFNLLLVGGFALIALLLATVGVYGLMSFAVTSRTQEIGIRIALGAESRDIRRLVLKRGLAMALAGIVIGVAGSLALTRLIQNLLFGVSPSDPFTLVLVMLILTGVALGACLVPARKATKVDPMVALRYE